MSKKVYMVHKGKKAMFTYSKKEALQLAKKHDAQIRFMSYGLYKDGRFWDYPTFHIQSEPLEIK